MKKIGESFKFENKDKEDDIEIEKYKDEDKDTTETNSNNKSLSISKEKEIKVDPKYLDPNFDDLLGWDIDEQENIKNNSTKNALSFMFMI